MNTVRAFFAIKPPEAMLEPLAMILRLLSRTASKYDIRWVKPEQLHITLQFLKNINLEDIDPLIKKTQVELASNPAFQIELGGLEWFPSLEHPKIISLGVGPQQTLRELSSKLGQLISDFNYPVETRRYKGHMTLGRLPPHHIQKMQLPLITLPKIPVATIHQFYLMESKPEKGRGTYCSLAQFDLAACSQ